MVDDPRGRGLRPGDAHYRAYVGSPEQYDVFAALQFTLLTALGLREEHTLLDIGCGSLRAGRLLIPYLLPGRYFGLEPERWLVEEGLRHELGADVVARKEPTFRYTDDLALGAFGRQFDFLLAHSIFSHAPAGDVRFCLAEAATVMHEDSVFVATFVRGKLDYTGNDWVYPGTVTYRSKSLSDEAREHGLRCRTLDWPHPDDQTWIVLTKGAQVEPAFRPRRRARHTAPLGGTVGRGRGTIRA